MTDEERGRDNYASNAGRIYELLQRQGSLLTKGFLLSPELISAAQDRVAVTVNSKFMQEHVIGAYLKQITDATKQVLGPRATVAIVVDRDYYNSVMPERVQKIEPQTTYQLPPEYLKKLGASVPDSHTFDTFIEYSGNSRAIEEARKRVESLGSNSSNNPLCLIGTNGSGKTALLSAILNEAGRARFFPGYLDVHSLSFYFQIHEGARPELRPLTDDAKLLAIDSLDGLFFRGNHREGCQKVVHDLFHSASTKKKPIIVAYTGDINSFQKFLQELREGKNARPENQQIRANLVDRLQESTRIQISYPKEEERVDFMKHLLLQYRKAPEQEELEKVAGYLSSILPPAASIRCLRGIIGTALGYIGRDGPALTLQYARQAFSGYQPELFESPINPDKILKRVGEIFPGVSIAKLQGSSREKNTVLTRQFAAFALRDAGLSLKETGKLLGNRGHSWVIGALKSLGGKVSEKELVNFLAQVKELQG